jgi:hypothetical protein
MDLGMQPLIDRLNRAKATCVFLDLFMDNPETSSSKFPTIAPLTFVKKTGSAYTCVLLINK